ncbi:Fibrinogen silencer-binding protein, partial [Camponotus floridanus]
RTKNFTEAEKMLLIELVQERRRILENKTTNNVSIKEKEDCWENLRMNFMSRSKGVIRTVQSLKTCWKIFKKGPKNNMLKRNRQFIK